MVCSQGTFSRITPNRRLEFADLLHPEETTIFNGYRLAKRRAEYLTGRICAKIAVQGFLTKSKTHPKALALPEIEITNAPNGRPLVRLDWQRRNTPRMDISISHSGDYGVAIAAGSRCGIDLQVQKTTLLRVQEKYCHETEYRLLETSLPNYGALTRQTILWAAKEAGKKALSHWQMPGFLDLQLRSLKYFPDYIALSLQINNTTNQQLPKEATVVAGLFGEYALAICLIPEELSNAGTP